MSDIQEALATVREGLELADAIASGRYQGDAEAEAHEAWLNGSAALNTIEQHLAVSFQEGRKRGRDSRDRKREAMRKRAEAAEAAMREVLDHYGDYEEFDPLRRVLGLPLWDSQESWERRGDYPLQQEDR